MCSPHRSPREQVLAELAAADPAGLPAEALMKQIADLAAFADQVGAELARRAAALDAAGAGDYGHASAAAFLRTVCGRSPARASELVAIGRALLRLPDTRKALAAGEISFDQALVVTRTADAITGSPGAGQRAAAPQTTESAGAAEVAAAAAERILLDAAARGVSTAQLRRLGEEITYRAAPDAAEERELRRWEKRYLSFGFTVDDTGTISGACGDAVTFETIRTATEAFAPPGGTLDRRTAAQRRLDGLAAACKTALDTGTAPIRHRAAPHISVLVHDHTLIQAAQQQAGHGLRAAGIQAAFNQAASQQPTNQQRPAGTLADRTLADRSQADRSQADRSQADRSQAVSPQQPGPVLDRGPEPVGTHPADRDGAARGAPPGQTGHGQMLTAGQVLALCCGAEITAIRWEDGLPLDVGRAARTEPPALRKALEARDRTCRWPGCEAPGTWCTGHHIRGWANGARTSLHEMVLLCHLHHAHFVHQIGWTITGDPNTTVHFTHPDGGLTLDSTLPGATHPPGRPRAP